MKALQNLSIHYKLSLLVFSASLLVLLLSNGALLYQDFTRFSARMHSKLAPLASVLASQASDGLMFDDATATHRNLAALRSHPDIMAALVYDAQGVLFAAFPGLMESPVATTMQHTIQALNVDFKALNEQGQLFVLQGESHFLRTIVVNEKTWGVIHLVSSHKHVQKALNHQVSVSLSILAASMLLILLLSLWLPQLFSTPIQTLRHLMRRVSIEKNYTLRAADLNHDEIGDLAAVFNEMLQEIERREKTLESYSKGLEQQVKIRTSELRSALLAAEAANQAKSSFLSNMSHELRTPLNAVLGFAQILQRNTSLSILQQEQLGHIFNGGNHLLNLINDILDLSKIETEQFELLNEPLCLDTFFKEISQHYQQQAEKKGLILTTKYLSPLPSSIEIDPKCLRQILSHLLDNAIKFTAQGSIKMQVNGQNEQLMVEILDTGSGIPLTQQRSVFKPFVQLADNPYKVQGSGLGLALSCNLTKLMNGHLGLRSSPGEGCCFTLKLPLKILSPNAKHSQAPPLHSASPCGYEQAEGQTLRVLVTDDVEDNRALLRYILLNLGFIVYEADSGESCLNRVEHYQPHLVLMDVCMPGMDGLETTRRLHQLPGLKRLPVVAVSASQSPEDIKNSLAAGCIEHLGKPIETEALLACLQAHLPSLQWIYDAAEESSTPPNASAHVTDLPQDIRDTLHNMAERGKITEITQHLDHLSQQEDCAKEVFELLKLARAFRMKELRQRLAE